ncbi:MAG: ABC transporter substrate-binding protein [Candidatus Binataceae bacterium]
MKLAPVLLSLAIVTLLGGCNSYVHSARSSSSGQRIVSLAPSVTETLFALGAGDEVVGVSQYCDYPPSVRQLPRVGSFITPNIEAIAALRPTLVVGLATASDLREIRALRAMGIATLMVDDGSVAAIERSIMAIGDHIGRGDRAHELVRDLREQVDAVRQRLRNQPRRSVLMVVGHQPMVAVGRGTFLDELLTLADAANIAAASDQAWPRLSVEYIIASRPEVILDGQMGTDPSTPGSFWSKYPTIPAVQNHRVLGYPDDPTLHPGPRIGITLDQLARLIHPAAFSTGNTPERAP